jgi:hypothetical protein
MADVRGCDYDELDVLDTILLVASKDVADSLLKSGEGDVVSSFVQQSRVDILGKGIRALEGNLFSGFRGECDEVKAEGELI